MLSGRETFVYKRVGGCEIAADVYAPDKPPPRPALVWIHGGALIAGDRTQVRLRREHLRSYLAAGFVVVAIDHRLAPETRLPAIVEDVRDAFGWVRRDGPGLFGVDPGRVGVVGHSAGGYLALASGLHVDPPPTAIGSVYGFADIAGPWLTRPDPYYRRREIVAEADAVRAVGDREISGAPLSDARNKLYLYYRQRGLLPEALVGADPSVSPEAFEPWRIDRRADEGFPPTMLVHGDADTDVPHAQSLAMAARLAGAGAICRLATIPGAPHAFDVEDGWAERPEVREAIEGLAAFCARYA